MSETWNPADLDIPGRYGPDDTIGALNEITEAKVVEGVPPIFNRGVLLDVARLEGVEVRAGDVVNDNGRYGQSEPGLGLAAARWCTDRRVSVIGADNWAVEAVPGQQEETAFPVHQHCIAQHGCYLLENVATAALAGDEVYEFCWVILPARLRGATASIVSPVAVV